MSRVVGKVLVEVVLVLTICVIVLVLTICVIVLVLTICVVVIVLMLVRSAGDYCIFDFIEFADDGIGLLD